MHVREVAVVFLVIDGVEQPVITLRHFAGLRVDHRRCGDNVGLEKVLVVADVEKIEPDLVGIATLAQWRVEGPCEAGWAGRCVWCP